MTDALAEYGKKLLLPNWGSKIFSHWAVTVFKRNWLAERAGRLRLSGSDLFAKSLFFAVPH